MKLSKTQWEIIKLLSKGNEIIVPHKIFKEEDAERAIDESKIVIEEIKKLIEKEGK